MRQRLNAHIATDVGAGTQRRETGPAAKVVGGAAVFGAVVGVVAPRSGPVTPIARATLANSARAAMSRSDLSGMLVYTHRDTAALPYWMIVLSGSCCS
jgi:hypothetical protein